MFTGIIEAMGSLSAIEPRGGDLRLEIQSEQLDFSDVRIGDSICTNGCCLTAVELGEKSYVADVSMETINLTTLGGWRVGQPINLEKSLTPQARMGGHFVTGHVDGVGTVLSRESLARAEVFWLAAPEELGRYIAKKGSITVDGTSLTVNEVDGARFCLTIVPHTLKETLFGHYQPGDRVNLEVDLIARYLERLQHYQGPVSEPHEDKPVQ